MQVRNKFGHQVEVFFAILSALQFHLLFYCSRPLPNVLALGLGRLLDLFIIHFIIYMLELVSHIKIFSLVSQLASLIISL